MLKILQSDQLVNLNITANIQIMITDVNLMPANQTK